MKEIIKDLYKFNRCLLGEGYDNALEYLKMLLPFNILEFPSGTKLETWDVPQEWVVTDAWVKYKGKKVLDYKKNPLCLVVGSIPFKGKLDQKELKKHLFTTDNEDFELEEKKGESTKMKGMPQKQWEAVPYKYKFYEKDWGFCISRKGLDKFDGKEYEVFVDARYQDGVMKIAEHTIVGKSEREIVLIAHLDHPFQANDNLSGVACLMDLIPKLKDKFDHTIKIIFCPETIGSVAYFLTQDISKVDFVLALDAVGNENSLLVQKSFNEDDKLNWATHLALQSLGKNYRRGQFRFIQGSDEYTCNDPKIGIPGLMISRLPYSEYHTSLDTPDIISEEKLTETQDFIIKLIEVMENNYIPERNFKGPLMRSKYKLQTFNREFNRSLDYLMYLMDGKRDIITLCIMSGIGWDYTYKILNDLKNENIILDTGKKPKQTIN